VLKWGIRIIAANSPQATSTGPDGGQHEFIRNDAERHVYILSFGRDGTYQRSTEIEPSFPVQRLGVFQSGTLLAYGHDWKSRSRRLALLKKDGTLLKELQVPADDAPDPTLGEGRSSRAAQLRTGVQATAVQRPTGHTTSVNFRIRQRVHPLCTPAGD
jgi:hypothetical protein